MDVVSPHKETVRLRLALIVGALLLCCFMWADIVLLPDNLHDTYFFNRLYIQVPTIALVVGLSYAPFFYAKRHWIFTLLMVVLTLSNFGLIYQCWVEASFAFPYEGTILYAFYCVFALGVPFKLALLASVINVIGFVLLMMASPAYGERVMISSAFVAGSLFICVYAKYRLDRVMQQWVSSNEKLVKLSRIDPLTNLLNRRALMQRSEALLSLSIRQSLDFAVIMLDLDDFKKYNDAFGHQKGDDVIVMQADIMREVFKRQTDVLGRYGGEEFMVVVSGLNGEQVQSKCEQIKTLWQSRNIVHAGAATHSWVTCSMGIASMEKGQNTSLEALIQIADKALYEAKSAGKNSIKLEGGANQS